MLCKHPPFFNNIFLLSKLSLYTFRLLLLLFAFFLVESIFHRNSYWLINFISLIIIIIITYLVFHFFFSSHWFIPLVILNEKKIIFSPPPLQSTSMVHRKCWRKYQPQTIHTNIKMASKKWKKENYKKIIDLLLQNKHRHLGNISGFNMGKKSTKKFIDLNAKKKHLLFFIFLCAIVCYNYHTHTHFYGWKYWFLFLKSFWKNSSDEIIKNI